MTEVDFVGMKPGSRVQVRFESGRAVLHTAPVRWRDWVVRFWIAAAASLALAWIGFLVYQAGSPEKVATAFAAPGGALFLCLIVYGVLAVLTSILTLGTRQLNLAWLARRVDRRAGAPRPQGVFEAQAISVVSARRRFRRTVVRVEVAGGRPVTFTRWGGRPAGRALADGFQRLAATGA